MAIISKEYLEARGHPMIRALHAATFEITKDSDIGPRGDCIIGVNLDRGVGELNEEFKNILRKNFSIVLIALYTEDNIGDIVIATGSPRLLLKDDRRIVVRKSSFIGPETLAIRANKAARDINRAFIKRVQDPSTKIYIELYAIELGNSVNPRLNILLDTDNMFL